MPTIGYLGNPQVITLADANQDYLVCDFPVRFVRMSSISPGTANVQMKLRSKNDQGTYFPVEITRPSWAKRPAELDPWTQVYFKSDTAGTTIEVYYALDDEYRVDPPEFTGSGIVVDAEMEGPDIQSGTLEPIGTVQIYTVGGTAKGQAIVAMGIDQPTEATVNTPITYSNDVRSSEGLLRVCIQLDTALDTFTAPVTMEYLDQVGGAFNGVAPCTIHDAQKYLLSEAGLIGADYFAGQTVYVFYVDATSWSGVQVNLPPTTLAGQVTISITETPLPSGILKYYPAPQSWTSQAIVTMPTVIVAALAHQIVWGLGFTFCSDNQGTFGFSNFDYWLLANAAGAVTYWQALTGVFGTTGLDATGTFAQQVGIDVSPVPAFKTAVGDGLSVYVAQGNDDYTANVTYGITYG